MKKFSLCVLAGVLALLLLASCEMQINIGQPTSSLPSSPEESSLPQTSAPEESSSSEPQTASSEETPPTPPETETTLEFLASYPFGEDSLVMRSTGMQPDRNGVYSLDLQGKILADENGVLYLIPYFAMGDVINLTENKVAATFPDPTSPWPENVLYPTFHDGKLYLVQSDSLVVSFDLQTGEQTTYPYFRDTFRGESWFLVPGLCECDGKLLVAPGNREYYTPDGEKVSGVKALSVSVQSKNTLVMFDGKTLKFPTRGEPAEFTLLAGGRIMERWIERVPEKTNVFRHWYRLCDTDGNPISCFFAELLFNRETPVPCDPISFGDFTIDRFYPQTITVGGETFRNVALPFEVIGKDGTVYQALLYPDRLNLYKIHAGYTPPAAS